MNIRLIKQQTWSLTVALLFVLGFISKPGLANSDEQANAIIQKAIEGYGGEQSWTSKGTMIVHETQTRHTDEGTVAVKMVHYMDIAGDGYRVELDSIQGKQVFGWHGHHFWATQDGKPGDEELLKEARRVISDAYYRFSLPFVLANPDLEPRYEGIDNVNGIDTEVIKIAYRDGPTAGYWVEQSDSHQQTGQGHAAQNSEAGHGHHAAQEIYFFHFDKDYRIVKIYFSHHGDETYETFLFDDFKQVDGMLREHTRKLIRPDGNTHYETTFTSIEFKESLRPDFYSTPKS